MVRNAFLGDMLSTLFERRTGASLVGSKRSVKDMCTDLMTDMGEVSGIALATEILGRYSEMSRKEKLEFLAITTRSCRDISSVMSVSTMNSEVPSQ